MSKEQQPKEYQSQPTDYTPVVLTESPVMGDVKQDRRLSDEWDASKVPPSRFQKRKGSIYATPNSRDGHIDRNYADKYHAKIAEMKRGK
ncbi:uncharacterized protein MAM_02978 [Metarhizium album ARSEF 1941]|uniref:C6 zinc finger domain containing protein n=1 Tax=Metarhizium album (strain ARSEF 1941) TaxID=1081103 RepID=A0A0B2X259_METAS|nr:uncharacterized protein MAM_02978 [Metarhizium album ARSEF 1941]KHN99280.1 hypothetical protein MAM_02978 [Metarhizium album ARSEF 1941]